MVALARARVPTASFEVGSLDSVALPTCVGVVAVGEVLNYVSSPASGAARLPGLFGRAHTALHPGGVLLFDVAEPGRGAGTTGRHWEMEDWALLLDVAEDLGAHHLTRRLTTFVRADDTFRRHREVHRLDLYPREMVAELLVDAGFSATRHDVYGAFALPPGLVVFEAIKAT
jgi:hypothetical protein